VAIQSKIRDLLLDCCASLGTIPQRHLSAVPALPAWAFAPLELRAPPFHISGAGSAG
jgi:hypothetical protein